MYDRKLGLLNNFGFIPLSITIELYSIKLKLLTHFSKNYFFVGTPFSFAHIQFQFDQMKITPLLLILTKTRVLYL